MSQCQVTQWLLLDSDSDIEVTNFDQLALVPTLFSQPMLLVPSSFAKIPRVVINLHNSMMAPSPPPHTDQLPRCQAIDLCSAATDHAHGFFKHFSLTSRETHLANIKTFNALWKEDAMSQAQGAAIDELERKS